MATTADPSDPNGPAECSVDNGAVASLLDVCPDATVDGEPAVADTVSRRLEAIWVRGEPVLYIGKAGTSLQKRVGQYYTTKIGATGPHSGGWPIKMLANRRELWVHYGLAGDPEDAEKTMVDSFVRGVGSEARAALSDPSTPLPFANLEFPKGRRKNHGFDGVRLRKTSQAGPKRVLKPAAPTTACPTCFLTLPRTGVCDTCG